jgi:hypothetical protein
MPLTAKFERDIQKRIHAIINDEALNFFLLILGTRQKYLLLPLFNIVLEVLAIRIGQGKK